MLISDLEFFRRCQKLSVQQFHPHPQTSLEQEQKQFSGNEMAQGNHQPCCCNGLEGAGTSYYAGQPIRKAFVMTSQRSNHPWHFKTCEGAPAWPVVMAAYLIRQEEPGGNSPFNWLRHLR
jgi:hypothetical protein